MVHSIIYIFWNLINSMNVGFFLTLAFISAFYIFQSTLLQTKKNFFLVFYFFLLTGFHISNHFARFYLLEIERGILGSSDPIIEILILFFPISFTVLSLIALAFFIIVGSDFANKITYGIIFIFSTGLILTSFIGLAAYLTQITTQNPDSSLLTTVDAIVLLISLVSIVMSLLLICVCLYSPAQARFFPSRKRFTLAYQNFRALGVGHFLFLIGGMFTFWEGNISILHDNTALFALIGGIITMIGIFFITATVYGTRGRLKDEALVFMEHTMFEMKNLNELQEQFIAITAHELRTPITVIAGYIDLLNSHNISREDKIKSLDAMKRNLQRVMILIDNVHELSRSQVDLFHLNLELTDIGDLCEGIVDDLSNIAKKKGLKIAYTRNKLKANILRDDLQILIDPNRISQVLRNILHNSVKFTPQGEISVVLEPLDNHHLGIRVIDTGVGISSENLNGIFEPFSYHIQSSQIGSSGLGLGLFICKRIIEAHNGEITIKSKGHLMGTEVTITLPRNQN